MRLRPSRHGLTVLAVAGNHVVLLGWDLAKEAIVGGGVLGFAIRRTRHEDGDKRWLQGLKTFAATLPQPAPGVPVSSYRHPFQTFQWADYSAEPGKTYTYRIVPVSGTPAALVHGPAVEVTVTTERVDLGMHAVLLQPRRGRLAGVRAALPESQAARGRPGGVRLALARAGRGARVVHRPGRRRRRAARRVLRVQEHAHLRGAPRGARTRRDGRDPLRRRQPACRQRGGDGRPGPRRHGQAANALGRLRAQQVPRPEPRRPGERGLDRLDQPERERRLRPLEQRPPGARRRDRREVRALLAHPRRRPDEKADGARQRGALAAARAGRRRRDRGRLLAAPLARRARRLRGDRRRRVARAAS